MNAFIDKDGTLVIEPESVTESWALQEWKRHSLLEIKYAALAENEVYRGNALWIKTEVKGVTP